MDRSKTSRFGIMLLVCGFVFSQIGLTSIRASAQQPIITRTGYEIDSHGMIYLTARLNEKDEARFMLDTGSRTFLSDTLVARLGLKAHPMHGANGTELKFENGAKVQAATLTFSLPHTSITFSGEVMVLSADIIRNMGADCEGILGIDLLSAATLFLNPDSRQIAIMQGGNLDTQTLHRFGMDTVVPVPLTVDRAGFYRFPIEFPDVIKTTMMLDTGSEITKLPAGLAHQVSKAWKEHGSIGTARGTFPVYSAHLDRLRVGESEVHGQRIVYSELASNPPRPLGRDFLSRFEVLLDFPGKKAYLKPLGTAPAITPFAMRRLGEESALPSHVITFPYGGRAITPQGEISYKPGFSAFFSSTADMTQVKITRNVPPASAYNTPVEIPFEVEDGVILLPVTIEDRSVRMVLDTGSISSWLTPRAAQRLGITQGKTIEIGQAKVKQAVFNSVSLSTDAPDFLAYCDGFVAERPRFYRLTETPLPAQADGVLGLDYLSTQVFGLDMAHHKLILWPIASHNADRLRWLANGSDPTAANVMTIPLTHEWDDWFYASVTIGGQTLKLVVDTDYPGGGRLPDSSTAAEYGLALLPTSGTPQDGILKTLQIGDLTLEALPAKYVPSVGAQNLPLLGMDAFRNRRILFDLPGKILSLSKKPLP
ncbi:MAG: aspartyl protease [Chthonomonadaceae bacterium]|nr:aspartyl protease [Chthonomonadaceae bacterium]